MAIWYYPLEDRKAMINGVQRTGAIHLQYRWVDFEIFTILPSVQVIDVSGFPIRNL